MGLKLKRTYRSRLCQKRNNVKYFQIDLSQISEEQYRQLRKIFKDQNILQEIKKKNNDTNSLQILKNIIPFSVRSFEYFLNHEIPKQLNIIELIENVRKQKQDSNQNRRRIQKFEIKELKELIKQQNFIQQFSKFLSSKTYEKLFIDDNKRIQQEKKQSYKIASKMVLDELNKPINQRFQRFISKRNNMLQSFQIKMQESNHKDNYSQNQSENLGDQNSNYDHYLDLDNHTNNFMESN